jgi:thioredoxin-like negative regulator of GroEL
MVWPLPHDGTRLRSLRIRGIPSLFIFRQGQQLDHKSGAMQATMLVQWIDGVRAGMSTA